MPSSFHDRRTIMSYDHDDDNNCLLCDKEFNDDIKPCWLLEDVAVCEECRLEHAVGSCDYCDCSISMNGHPLLAVGCSYPLPPGTTHDNDEYFLCPDCAEEYQVEYPNWDSWLDEVDATTDIEDSSSDEEEE